MSDPLESVQSVSTKAKTSLVIEQKVWDRFKNRCDSKNISISKAVERLMQSYLDEYDKPT